MVNPDVDDYSKTLNHRNILRKTQTKQQPTENQKNTKTEIWTSWSPHLVFPGGGVPLYPRQLRHWLYRVLGLGWRKPLCLSMDFCRISKNSSPASALWLSDEQQNSHRFFQL